MVESCLLTRPSAGNTQPRLFLECKELEAVFSFSISGSCIQTLLSSRGRDGYLELKMMCPPIPLTSNLQTFYRFAFDQQLDCLMSHPHHI